ncbi:MAG: hypothetical protein P1T08_02640 [Acidimicrobiia bacterium]|nr:hypothetical protein [Acidimicrobiia bacterium]
MEPVPFEGSPAPRWSVEVAGGGGRIAEYVVDDAQCSLDVVEYVPFGEMQNRPASRPEPLVPALRVGVVSVLVAAAVHLDDQPLREASEVDDVGAGRFLTRKRTASWPPRTCCHRYISAQVDSRRMVRAYAFCRFVRLAMSD